MMAGVELCPICQGNGLVPYGFYAQANRKWPLSGVRTEMCRSCYGKGYIVISGPLAYYGVPQR